MPRNFAPVPAPKWKRETSDKLSAGYIGMLRKSMEQSFIELEPFRRKRNEVIEFFSGAHYSDNGSKVERPVNNIWTATEIYTLLLAANNPQVKITSDVFELRSLAADWEVVTNKLIEEACLKKKVRRWVRDAIFSIGIMKVGLGITDESYHIDDEYIPVTAAFAENVSLDDWGFDTQATEYGQIRYAFDRYQIKLETLERLRVPGRILANIKPARPDDSTFNRGEETAADITQQGRMPLDDGLEPVANVFDVWLPSQAKIITILDDALDEPLREVEWTGRRHGMYRLLGFSEVPDNVMPLGMAQQIRDLDEGVNDLYRKLFRQARRQKIVTLVQRGEEDDGDAVASSSDGEISYVDDPKNVQQVAYGGIDQGNLAFTMHLDDRLSRQAGNLDAMAGLGPQAETATQDQMIHGTVNAKLNKMSEILTDATCELVMDLHFLWWTDPERIYEGVRPLQVPNMNIGVPIGPDLQGLTPEHRADVERWFRFNTKVEPFSMRYVSPEERLQQLDDTLDRLGPYLPLAMEQGVMIDFEEYITLRAELLGNNYIKRLIAFASQAPQGQTNMRGEAPPMAPVTKRINERVNRPGGTRQGRDAAMFQSLLGKPPQGASGAALMRPPG